jgi:hypothetical protein
LNTRTQPERDRLHEKLWHATRENGGASAAVNDPQTGSLPTQTVLSIGDFVFHAPTGRYVYTPSMEWWGKQGVDSRLEWPGPKQPPSELLRASAAVDQVTWSPGDPQIIEHRLMYSGGWRETPNARCLNFYRPPAAFDGDPAKAQPWLDHVRALYGDEADHIIDWLSHRVQCPGQKINHALVLGGGQGIGKDTVLAPAVHGVGLWNVSDITPAAFVGRFNSWAKAVIVRINEARDRRECSPGEFYEHAKVYMAAPPEMLQIDEKGITEYKIPNVCSIVITTNNKLTGVHLPADDRRHFVAWSDVPPGDLVAVQRAAALWHWYEKRASATSSHTCERETCRASTRRRPRRARTHGGRSSPQGCLPKMASLLTCWMASAGRTW